jgi:hypothetical protein
MNCSKRQRRTIIRSSASTRSSTSPIALPLVNPLFAG